MRRYWKPEHVDLWAEGAPAFAWLPRRDRRAYVTLGEIVRTRADGVRERLVYTPRGDAYVRGEDVLRLA